MKISAFHKEQGDEVSLVRSYDGLDEYGRVYVSKVFSETEIPEDVLKRENVICGGTGFFFDKSPVLSQEMEHHSPDYHLYDGWVEDCIKSGVKQVWFSDYRDVSIGFTTRGCPRRCDFCVNRSWSGKVVAHSPVREFLDPHRKRIALWDDNVLAYDGWKEVFEELNATGKKFAFRQGLDVRLLTPEKARVINQSGHEYPIIFAFDNYKDREIIEEKLTLWSRERAARYNALVYLLCAYWKCDLNDIVEVLERIRILMKYRCLPYLMRHGNYQNSPFRGMYIAIASWCNQQNIFTKKSLREFGQWWVDVQGRRSAYTRYLEEFEASHPDVAKEFFDMKFPPLP
jgi:hypothetical protein